MEEDASLKQPCVLDNGTENFHVWMQISKKLVKFELLESSAPNHLISGSFTLIFCVFSFYKCIFALHSSVKIYNDAVVVCSVVIKRPFKAAHAFVPRLASVMRKNSGLFSFPEHLVASLSVDLDAVSHPSLWPHVLSVFYASCVIVLVIPSGRQSEQHEEVNIALEEQDDAVELPTLMYASAGYSRLQSGCGTWALSLCLARMLIVSVFCSYLAESVVVFHRNNQLLPAKPGK